MEQYLEHHGILGQKWGVRRFQNADGSLTEAGKKRFKGELAKNIGEKRLNNRQKYYEKLSKKSYTSLNESERDTATTVHLKQDHTAKAQADEKLKQYVGEQTIKQRTTIVSSAALISAGSAFVTSLDASLAIVPTVAIPVALASAGYAWYKSTK